MQWVLPEQQNKKRLLMARQEQNTIGLSSSQPSQESPLGARQASDHSVQNVRPGPSPAVPDCQAPLQIQRCEEQPMEARSGSITYKCQI